MTEPFPSEVYIEEVKKHPWLQEGWEPKFGDWVLRPSHHFSDVKPWVDTVWQYSRTSIICHEPGDHNTEWWEGFSLEEVVRLPTLRQLIEMIEERGYVDWELAAWAGETPTMKEGYYTLLWAKGDDGEPEEICKFGPDPETAVLRALAEVAEKKDG